MAFVICKPRVHNSFLVRLEVLLISFFSHADM